MPPAPPGRVVDPLVGIIQVGVPKIGEALGHVANRPTSRANNDITPPVSTPTDVAGGY